MAIINGVGRVGIRNYVSPIPQASTLINGLIHAWNANGNANDSIGGLNGTLTNGALANATPKIGSGAFYFDRINDYISLPDNSLNLDTDFTISFWCKDGFGGINRMIIHNTYFANDTHTSGWAILYGGNGIEFDIFNNNANVSLINTVGSFNRLIWNHVTVKYTRGVKMEIFLNGVLNATKNTTLTPLYSYTPIKTSIGSWNSLYSPTLYAGDGLLDAINIWDRALTSVEITELYGLTTELQAPTSSNNLLLKLDAGNAGSYPGTGTTWTDLSGNGNNGTLVNGTSYSSANGGIMIFDGINDYVNIPQSPTLSRTNTGALFLWVNQSSVNRNYVIIENGNIYYDNSAYGMYYYNGNEYVEIANNSTYNTAATYEYLSFDTWKQVGMVWNGTTLKKYINGVEVASTTQTINVNPTTQPFQIGRSYAGGGWYAKMSVGEVCLYNTITASEITANFNATKTRYGL